MEEKAKELAQDGAEAIVIGCSLYGVICSVARFVKLQEDIPIIDVMTVGFKMAEFTVDLKNSLGLPVISRVGKYQRVRDKDIQRLRVNVGLAQE